MNALLTAIREVYGLFVEDGSFAVGILAWVGIVAFLFPQTPLNIYWRAPLLFLGLIALLLRNVWKSARK